MVAKLELIALPDFPLIEPNDDIVEKTLDCLKALNITLREDDCLVFAQKIISKSENRYAYLADVTASEEAEVLAQKTHKDPRLVELILRESKEVLRHRPGAIIVEHKLGYVHANAGIDQSNIEQTDNMPRVLLLPQSPDSSAKHIRNSLAEKTGVSLSIIISDSAGRAWRNGIIGFALGSAGFEVVTDKVGSKDLFGRPLNVTQIAVADEVAAAASLLMGQADEANPVILVRGLELKQSDQGSQGLIRAKAQDLFR